MKVLLAVGVSALPGVFALPVHASMPMSAAGSFCSVITSETPRAADASGNVFIAFTSVALITGTVSGTRYETGELTIHPDGSIDAHNTGAFVGSVDGRSGTAMTDVEGVGNLGSVTGSFLLNRGTAALEHVLVEAQLAATPTPPTASCGDLQGAGFAGTYSGMFVTSGG